MNCWGAGAAIRQRKGPASGEAAGPARKMPMPWWRAWERDLRGREEKAPRLGGIRCRPVCRPFLKESFTSCKEVAGLLCEVTLDGQVWRADLPPEVARDLDGTRQYVVTLMATEVELRQVKDALAKIFEGKAGLFIAS